MVVEAVQRSTGRGSNCVSDSSTTSNTLPGLTEVEAQGKSRSEGYNELPRGDRRTPLRIVIEVLRAPMLILLLGGGLIHLIFGDLKEAPVLLAFATMSVVITVVQESRTERVLRWEGGASSRRLFVTR